MATAPEGVSLWRSVFVVCARWYIQQMVGTRLTRGLLLVGRLSHAFCRVPRGETFRDGAGAVCEELDVPYLVDAYQVTGQLPIDVGQMVRRR